MKQVFIFLANGFEEIEAVSIIDILRRGELRVNIVSITGNLIVSGAHEIRVSADILFEQADFTAADMLVLPGGMPGSNNLNAHKELKNCLIKHNDSGKNIAAICAAPLVLGGLGILKNKNVTCYPGFEPTLLQATPTGKAVEKDGNVITGKGPGLVFEFALAIITELLGQAKADEVAKGLLFN